MYRLGIKPWEIDSDPAELAALIDDWPGAPGRALDLGCGTGRQTLLLAQHGWDVVGVDFVQSALASARGRLDAAGVNASLVLGDVTRLGALSIGNRFDLVLDLKCFHGLPAADRSRYVEGVVDACKPGAAYLLFALPPNRARGLLGAPRGVSRPEVEQVFEPSFELLEIKEAAGGPFTSGFYRMRRRVDDRPATR
jgi:SAM-dependent methyltransferase